MFKITRIKYFTFIIYCVLLSVASPNTMAATFNVNNNADVGDIIPGDGTCETGSANGICTLRAAIDESNAFAGADVINLPEDTYTIQTGASYTNSSGSFFVTDEVDIIGQNATTTILDANNLDRVMVVSASGIINISNVTIQNGFAGTSGAGGGIAASGPSLQLSINNSIIRNNQANTGAGLSTFSPVLSISLENCLIENNTGIAAPSGPSSNGGGINFSTGLLTVTKSTIRNNTSNFGGGIFTIGDIVLVASTVSENTSTVPPAINGGFGGGGLHIGSGSNGSLIAINSTISGNRAYTSGAGILMVNGTASIFNTTITNNIADSDSDNVGYGGGIIASYSSPGPSINISNSIIAGNSGGQQGPDCNDLNILITSLGYNLIGDATDCNFSAGTGDLIGDAVTQIDPLLSALSDNGGSTLTHALISGSAAIDAGNPTGCNDNYGSQIVNDQRDLPRHVDGGSGSNRCDIGAFEIEYLINADAGEDQSVVVDTPVDLNGSNSQASSGITAYAWAQTDGTAVTLNNENTATPNFTSPSIATTIILELTITDSDGRTAVDDIIVRVTEDSSSSSSGGNLSLITIIIFMITILYSRKYL